MLLDPVSALVVVGALGFGGVLRTKDDQILQALERRLEANAQHLHRIVIEDIDTKLQVASEMSFPRE